MIKEKWRFVIRILIMNTKLICESVLREVLGGPWVVLVRRATNSAGGQSDYVVVFIR